MPQLDLDPQLVALIGRYLAPAALPEHAAHAAQQQLAIAYEHGAANGS